MSEHHVVDLAKPEETQEPRQQAMDDPVDWHAGVDEARQPMHKAVHEPQPMGAIASVLSIVVLGFAAYKVCQAFSHDAPAAPAAAARVPGCGDPATRQALTSIGRELSVGAGAARAELFPTVSKVREFGYASAERQRGCIAELTVAGQAIAFAYEIGAVPGFQQMAVMGGDPAILKARFSQIGSDGRFRYQAEPVGRAAMKAALRAGVDAMRPAYAGSRMPDAGHPLFSTVNPDRQHEIADVEPVGACREIKQGSEYACPVMIEHASPIGNALGLPDTIFQAEFTFVRQPGAAWAMAEGFPAAFSMAAFKGRTE